MAEDFDALRERFLAEPWDEEVSTRLYEAAASLPIPDCDLCGLNMWVQPVKKERLEQHLLKYGGFYWCSDDRLCTVCGRVYRKDRRLEAAAPPFKHSWLDFIEDWKKERFIREVRELSGAVFARFAVELASAEDVRGVFDILENGQPRAGIFVLTSDGKRAPIACASVPEFNAEASMALDSEDSVAQVIRAVASHSSYLARYDPPAKVEEELGKVAGWMKGALQAWLDFNKRESDRILFITQTAAEAREAFAQAIDEHFSSFGDIRALEAARMHRGGCRINGDIVSPFACTMTFNEDGEVVYEDAEGSNHDHDD